MKFLEIALEFGSRKTILTNLYIHLFHKIVLSNPGRPVNCSSIRHLSVKIWHRCLTLGNFNLSTPFNFLLTRIVSQNKPHNWLDCLILINHLYTPPYNNTSKAKWQTVTYSCFKLLNSHIVALSSRACVTLPPCVNQQQLETGLYFLDALIYLCVSNVLHKRSLVFILKITDNF